MKAMIKSRLGLAALLAVLFLPSGPARTQETWRERLAPVLALRDSLIKTTPFHDEENHLTIQALSLNVDGKFLRMNMAMDKGYPIHDADWYLDYLTHSHGWDFAPLGEFGFEVRLLVQTDKQERKGSGGGSYTYSPNDILQSVQPSWQKQARAFIAAYARHVAQTLPYSTGNGETMVGCRYDDKSLSLTTTFEYSDDLWAEVRQYIEDNYGAVRKERALALVEDTATSLAFAAYKGGVTLGYVFRNRSLHDSISMAIPPWMWEPVFNTAGQSAADTLGMVQHIADEVNRQCPSAVGGGMTLTSCRLDTAARVLVYNYTVDEATLRAIQGNEAVQQSLREAVERSFRSNAGRVLGKYAKAAHVQVEYRYASGPSSQPFVVTLTPRRIGEITGTR